MTENKSPRVRFAPSPTGLLHIGGARTALFNYLFAKHNKGAFILRLEDTDRERFVPDSVDQIQQALQWLDIVPDEGYWMGEHKGDHAPYSQHERVIKEKDSPHYKSYAESLIKQGLAYYSRIKPEDFKKLRDEAIAAKRPFAYREQFEPEDDNKTTGYPIRLKVPGRRTVSWKDEVRGDFHTESELIDDFVLIKADGYPTYNFANVVDDYTMQISHVIRGDEFIASTAKHTLLYELFGWDMPQFIHLPAILGPDGAKKLSKRDGDVDVLDYKQAGFLPETMVNFLALLGWNDGTEQEIFSRSELIDKFSIARVAKSPAVFDRTRLEWMNGKWIREQLSLDELVKLARDYVPKQWMDDSDYFKKVIALDRERIKFLSELPELIDFFFDAPHISLTDFKKHTPESITAEVVDELTQTLESVDFSVNVLEQCLRAFCESNQIKPKELFGYIRFVLSGKTAAPGIFDTLAILGKPTVIDRLNQISKLHK